MQLTADEIGGNHGDLMGDVAIIYNARCRAFFADEIFVVWVLMVVMLLDYSVPPFVVIFIFFRSCIS